jgi:phosphate starvation-inducible protein PhoH and related proteins
VNLGPAIFDICRCFMFEATLSLIEPERVLTLFGPRDLHLRALREAFGVSVSHRNGQIRVTGDELAVATATHLLEQFKATVERTGKLETEEVTRAIERAVGKTSLEEQPIDVFTNSRRVLPRTAGQARYADAIRKHDLTFAIGPAGSGKTYLAVALAVEALKHKRIRKIVLVRPAVEAGESLGYLPGDLQAKINPYLRPLLDSLHDMMDHELIKRYIEQDIIEVIPLAYMRGRTLNEAFIILDEGQNATFSQMKMFLTRMGTQSKIVVSGDVTQVDLPRYSDGGLTDAIRRLESIPGIAVVKMTQADIVRHRLVADIVRAYDDESHSVTGERL